MIDFHRIRPEDKEEYEKILMSVAPRGCEYSFCNLYFWGRQEIAFIHGCVAFFAHYQGRSVYPYPIGNGDKKAVLEAILADAQERGIPCRIGGISPADRHELGNLMPGRFYCREDRDGADYVYTVEALADLRGNKLQRKRNHVNRFRAAYPDYQVEPITEDNLEDAAHLVYNWYKNKQETTGGDFLLEQIAMDRAFSHFTQLGLFGLLLSVDGEYIAMTMGSRMNRDTVDVHFEKARDDIDGSYAAINSEFARYIRDTFPEIQYLNREDDMGLEGLRKAKLSYQPHHMMEKCQAFFVEDVDDPSLP